VLALDGETGEKTCLSCLHYVAKAGYARRSRIRLICR
jgi:hypothetical protein